MLGDAFMFCKVRLVVERVLGVAFPVSYMAHAVGCGDFSTFREHLEHHFLEPLETQVKRSKSDMGEVRSSSAGEESKERAAVFVMHVLGCLRTAHF